MKILLVSATYAPVIGGAETYALGLHAWLTRHGHEVLAITDEPIGITQNEIEGEGIVRLCKYREKLGAPGTIWWEQMLFGPLAEVEERLHGFTPHVVISNSLDAAIFATMVASSYDVPTIGAFHEQEPEKRPYGVGTLKLVYGRLGLKLILAGARLYAERAVNYGAPLDRVALIYHGVDLTKFNPDVDGEQVRQGLGISDDVVLISSSGRLTPRKGHTDLVAAFAIVHEEYPNTHLLLAGSVSSTNPDHAIALQEQVDYLGLRGAVTFREDLQLDDMPSIYSASQIVAQLSWAEGFGLAVLEAAASGRAVLTTDIPATQDLLSAASPHTSEPPMAIVPSRQPLVAAAALGVLVASERKRRRLGELGRDFVQRYYDGGKTASSTVEAIERAVIS